MKRLYDMVVKRRDINSNDNHHSISNEPLNQIKIKRSQPVHKMYKATRTIQLPPHQPEPFNL